MITAASSDERFRTEAFDATWAADHDRALAALHNGTWRGSSVMRARIYARKGLVERLLSEKRLTPSDEPEDAVEIALLLAEVFAAGGRRADALLALHDAELALRDLADRTLHAQHRVAVAFVDLSHGDLRSARAAIAAGFELTEQVARESAHDHRLETNHLRARLFAVRARLHALAHDRAAQLDDLCRAIGSAKLVRKRDAWHEAGILASISEILGVFPEPSARLLFVSSYAELRWNAHLESAESTVRSNLARASMLFGLHDGLDPAGTGASSLCARVALEADRLLFDEVVETAAFERGLEFAASLAESADWNAVTGEEMLGLATLAAVLAPYDVVRASALAKTYDRSLATLSRVAPGFREPRRIAFDDFARACLAKARGDVDDARQQLDDCLAFWEARGMHAWCALGALERYPLSRDEADLLPARRFVARWPRSPFARRLRASTERAASEPSPAFPYLRGAVAVVDAAAG